MVVAIVQNMRNAYAGVGVYFMVKRAPVTGKEWLRLLQRNSPMPLEAMTAPIT